MVHESLDFKHIWYCVSENQTPLRGSFETLQGYWLHFVRSLSKNRKQRDWRGLKIRCSRFRGVNRSATHASKNS